MVEKAVLTRSRGRWMGEDGDDIPASWPEHLDAAAVEALNNHILPHLKFSPNELLLGLVINTSRTPGEISTTKLNSNDISIQMAYVDQQRTDGYAQMIKHANKRKLVFDKKVLQHAPRKVIFKAGQLVQVYRSNLDFTVRIDRKMLPKWSTPRRVTSCNRNLYKIETLEGLPIGGQFSAQWLRRFIPHSGTTLNTIQNEIKKE